jgi:hypothetical protein
MMGDAADPPDPPMEPMVGTTIWYETGPNLIHENASLATLVVKLGMISNAIAAQLFAGLEAHRQPAAARGRNVLCSLISSAALTHEALRHVGQAKHRLGDLMIREANEDSRARVEHLLERVGQLCAGRHPASDVLARARNNVGFHWDEDVIEPTVRAFGRNKAIVWIESVESPEPQYNEDHVHRLASDVLAITLIPELTNVMDNEESDRIMNRVFEHVRDAMRLVMEFCSAASFAYLTSNQVERRRKEAHE